jgi:ribosomal RNA-processing protein 12
MIKDDDEGKNRKKRKRRDDLGFGSDDDSDMEDMRGFAGLDAAVRSVANAKSVRFAPSIAASLGNRSLGQRSSGSKQGGRPGSGSQGSGKQHTGDRYKPKAAGASGDVKGKAAVDPYAYWQFDRKMLNRRRGKQATAAKGLGGIVGGAQAGALKGAKAKRAAAASSVKRAKR